jgi:hypothetical protein
MTRPFKEVLLSVSQAVPDHTPEEARFFLGKLIGGALLIWLLSFAIRKVGRIGLHLSYLLSIAFCVAFALTISPRPSEFAALYIIAGLLVWVIHALRYWVANRKSGATDGSKFKSMKSSKGINRLAVVLGSISAAGLFVFAMLATEFFSRVREDFHWDRFVESLLAFFFLPFLLVHAIGWVVRGFQEDKK